MSNVITFPVLPSADELQSVLQKYYPALVKRRRVYIPRLNLSDEQRTWNIKRMLKTRKPALIHHAQCMAAEVKMSRDDWQQIVEDIST